MILRALYAARPLELTRFASTYERAAQPYLIRVATYGSRSRRNKL